MLGTVLITGASSGIGLASAIALWEKGFRVFAGVRSREAENDLHSKGLSTVILDVTDPAVMSKAVGYIEKQAGGIDILVNSAGYGLMGPVEELDRSSIRNQFEVNVFGLLRMCQLVLPRMRAQRRGRIIQIGSMGGLFTAPGAGAYHMTKYALEALTDAMRAEVGGFGVQIALIEPTGVRTAFVHKQVNTTPVDLADAPYGLFKAAMAKMAEGLFAAQSRVVVTPEEVARAVVHAATAPHPRTRYPVGAIARLLPVVRRLTPDRLWDRAMLAQVGVTPGREHEGS